MGKEIIINARKDQTRIAIVENGDLAEMYFEDPDNERTLGDIYLGRVRRIMPSIQAAFIDIGQASDAFLHFSDIADNVGDMIRLLDMSEPDVGKLEISSPVRRRRPRGPAGTQVSMDDDEDHAEEEARQGKSGRQQRGNSNGNGQSGRGSRSSGDSGNTFRPEDLKKDQKILVKIVKEPISSKGSRVSTDISLAGRFLVLVPLADYVAVSKKIVSYKERRRLRALAKSLLPKGFGLIVRTVAEDKNAKALDTDLRLLVEKWRRIEKRLAEVKNPPAVLHQDVNMVSSVIRDLFSDDYERILIDDQRVYKNVKGYIQAVAPQMAPAVKMHSDRKPIFHAAGVEKAVRQAFESRVDLPSGGYLIIEHTEAMHVIDVNSGRAGRGLSQEQNSLKVNIESARMIAQQLRLRDLGGIIVVDFIDLRDDKNRKKVYDELKKHFRKDRAVTKILPMSDFGLMQITRQRLRPSITTIKKSEDDRGKSAAASPANTEQQAPSTPRMTPNEWREKLERWVVRYHEKGKRKPLILRVHPFAKSYLGRGVARATLKWFWKYRIRVGVETDAEQNPMSFRFFDAESGNELTRRRRSGRRRGKKRSRDNRNAGENSGNRSERGSGSDSGKRSGGRDNKPGNKSESKSESKSGGRSGGRSGRRSSERSGKSSGRSGTRASGNRPDSRAEKSDSGSARASERSGSRSGGRSSRSTGRSSLLGALLDALLDATRAAAVLQGKLVAILPVTLPETLPAILLEVQLLRLDRARSKVGGWSPQQRATTVAGTGEAAIAVTPTIAVVTLAVATRAAGARSRDPDAVKAANVRRMTTRVSSSSSSSSSTAAAAAAAATATAAATVAAATVAAAAATVAAAAVGESPARAKERSSARQSRRWQLRGSSETVRGLQSRSFTVAGRAGIAPGAVETRSSRQWDGKAGARGRD